MELARLAPVFGTWTTFSHYLGEVSAGEYPPIMTADDFHFDYLSERIAAQSAEPVSASPGISARGGASTPAGPMPLCTAR